MIKKTFLLSLIAIFTVTTAFSQEKLSYEGYKLKFEDHFDGKSLNKKYWNFEKHEPGWVNNELQSYIENKKNVYLKDGNLVIQPIKTTDKRGNATYTSGRINTMGKVTAKYGIFEARLKVPQGQGYLPAFWMMPNNESLYGQWPLCGEIDIMEVLGHEINKVYSTLHFGQPHTQKQVSSVLEKGDFANEFHTFSCEWNPNEFRYYVDGVFIGSITEWFTKKAGDTDPLTFPAPYDQPYYIILNVAVGGDWPGYPDETTTFDEKAQMVVDYVRIYQKNSYDENVKMKEMDVAIRSGDASGNYVSSNKWEFMSQQGGEGSAEITPSLLTVNTKSAGGVDYSIQLVQADIPLVKGGFYEFSFDAYSTENRSMMAGITGPNNGYVRYFGDEKISMTPAKKNYKFNFQMKETTDPACRIDFNMGATSSTAPIYISNVVVKQTGIGKIAEPEKSITADGNYVYNGGFDKGEGRFKYWTKELKDGATLEITNKDNIRECKVNVKKTLANAAVLIQDKIPLAPNTEYILSASSKSKGFEKTKFYVNDKLITLEAPTKEGKPYSTKFTTDAAISTADGKSVLKIAFENEGEYIFDDVRIGEASLVKNRLFEKGMSGWELYAFSTGDASVAVDGGAITTITDTTADEWKIQLKQNDIYLEKGAGYKLSFDIEASVDRDVKYALQRDGTRWLALYGEEDWTGYNSSPTVSLKAGKKQTVVQEFDMTYEDDEHVILTFSMGAVSERITKEHTVKISNVNLEVTGVQEKVEGWEGVW